MSCRVQGVAPSLMAIQIKREISEQPGNPDPEILSSFGLASGDHPKQGFRRAVWGRTLDRQVAWHDSKVLHRPIKEASQRVLHAAPFRPKFCAKTTLGIAYHLI
jgi:hypothetical protein